MKWLKPSTTTISGSTSPHGTEKDWAVIDECSNAPDWRDTKADDWGERKVLVRGRVADVCQRKGCWTILQDGETRVRVRFKDYAFFLPTDCNGREALVEGIVEVKTLSEAMARHYEEESTDGAPEAVQGPRREVGITASGVRLLP